MSKKDEWKNVGVDPAFGGPILCPAHGEEFSEGEVCPKCFDEIEQENERLNKDIKSTNEQENHWYNEAVRLQHRNGILKDKNKKLEAKIGKCPQCGQYFHESACGPTHAVRFNMLLKPLEYITERNEKIKELEDRIKEFKGTWTEHMKAMFDQWDGDKKQLGFIEKYIDENEFTYCRILRVELKKFKNKQETSK